MGRRMRWMVGLSLLVGLGVPNAVTATPQQAVVAQLPTQQLLAQSRSPRLSAARTTSNRVYARHARYYFSVELPPTAIAPVQKIHIHQRTGSETIRLRPDQSIAFLGTSRRKGEVVELTDVTWDRDARRIELTLATPIEPGETVTLGLRPVQNPRYSGEYGFGVTVFATPEQTEGLYLGPGRLRFYDLDRYPRFP